MTPPKIREVEAAPALAKDTVIDGQPYKLWTEGGVDKPDAATPRPPIEKHLDYLKRYLRNTHTVGEFDTEDAIALCRYALNLERSHEAAKDLAEVVLEHKDAGCEACKHLARRFQRTAGEGGK